MVVNGAVPEVLAGLPSEVTLPANEVRVLTPRSTVGGVGPVVPQVKFTTFTPLLVSTRQSSAAPAPFAPTSSSPVKVQSFEPLATRNPRAPLSASTTSRTRQS